MPFFKRDLKLADSTFFLFGPRGTGKSTWLKHEVKADLFINLLRSQDFLRFSQHPEELGELVNANPNWRKVIVDEIQKAPQLLDEIHALIFETNKKIQFILTGSSARKLKKENVNLLAGRALVRKFHPLCAVELGKVFNVNKALTFGLLPEVWTLDNESSIKDYLFSYVETYLREEIQQEALIRNIPAYSKFLEHMALRNSHVINLQNLSGEIGVARTTLTGYLQILQDTLLGFLLPPIQLRAKVKEIATPKFYFFDPGVVRALALVLDEPLGSLQGAQLESYVYHELLTFSDYHQKRWDFAYWATPSKTEVDFIVSSGRKNIGIEVKSSTHWDKDFSYGLNVLLKDAKIEKAYGIYLGEELIRKGDVLVIPAKEFSKFLRTKDLFDV